ncbi:MAG: hypothetical protein JWQ03_395 [Variovorax sp.]|nr:hypothetical protein [Variovorax sp.]
MILTRPLYLPFSVPRRAARAARARRALATTLLGALCLAGCSSPGRETTASSQVPGQLSGATREHIARAVPPPSNAGDARAYRRDAARHVYEINRTRVYAGKLPPMLYAIGTLQVRLDAGGRVSSMHWLRAPTHAPEVVAEIERSVLDAAPFPVASRLGAVIWTDTWLWDRGGQFQLDTLSEGQE